MGRKRGNGEGTIYQTSEGRWIAQASINGKRRSVYGKTRKEVQAKLRTLLSNAEQGIMPGPQRLTVAQFMAYWLEDVARPRVRKRTFESYDGLVRNHIVPALGRMKLGELQAAHLQKLYKSLREKNLSAASVQRVHAVIRSGLRHAVDIGVVSRSVATMAHPPTPERAEFTTLTPEQVRALLSATTGTRHRALLTVAVYCGLRQGEVLGLKWEDIDADAATLKVRRQLGHDGNYCEPKTKAARRTVDLSQPVLDALKSHRVAQLQDRLTAGSEWEENGLVFSTHRGRPLGYRNVIRDFHALLDRSGLPRIRFHDLRHTTATLQLASGADIKQVQDLLGHSQVTLTLGTYTHVQLSRRRDAANRLAALLA